MPSPMAFSVMPNILGMEGPVISASSTADFLPRAATAEASMEVTRDLPTPPLPLTTPITLPTRLNSLRFSFCIALREAQSLWLQLLQSWVHSLIVIAFRVNVFWSLYRIIVSFFAYVKGKGKKRPNFSQIYKISS